MIIFVKIKIPDFSFGTLGIPSKSILISSASSFLSQMTSWTVV